MHSESISYNPAQFPQTEPHSITLLISNKSISVDFSSHFDLRANINNSFSIAIKLHALILNLFNTSFAQLNKRAFNYIYCVQLSHLRVIIIILLGTK